MVICHCRESLDWLQGPSFYVPKKGAAVDVFIYEKCNFETNLALSPKFRSVSRIIVDDQGMRRDECSGYLRHLIDHYQDPADYTFFFQADAEDHMHFGYLSLVLKSIEQHALTSAFVHLNYPRLITSMSPCRAEVFRQLFDRYPGRNLGSYCCAQFMVSKERLLANPLERYQRMQQMLFSDSPAECHDIPGHSTLCLMFEVYWHVLFGEPDVLPLRSENSQLQLFLRIRDLENESYLPQGSMYLKLASERESDQQRNVWMRGWEDTKARCGLELRLSLDWWFAERLVQAHDEPQEMALGKFNVPRKYIGGAGAELCCSHCGQPYRTSRSDEVLYSAEDTTRHYLAWALWKRKALIVCSATPVERYRRRLCRSQIYCGLAVAGGLRLLLGCRWSAADLLYSFSAEHQVLFSMAVAHWLVSVWEDSMNWTFLRGGLSARDTQNGADPSRFLWQAYLVHHLVAAVAFGAALRLQVCTGLAAFGLVFEMPVLYMNLREFIVYADTPVEWFRDLRRVELFWGTLLLWFRLARGVPTLVYFYSLIFWYEDIGKLSTKEAWMYHGMAIFFTAAPLEGIRTLGNNDLGNGYETE
ncbi:unnamed protein product [Effrenium voratum]|nr:unnamed protein product [Effrenium voratum]